VKRLLIILLCWFPTWLWAAAGKLDSFEGDVKIVVQGNSRNAVPGAEVNEGDQVRTGANAWALFEMSDGATITVRPSTEIRISRYRYAEDGPAAQNSSVIDLAKGALRIITGLIGQSNRQGYAVNTPTATIGIRGTDHEPAYYPAGDAEIGDHEPGAFDKVNEGETFIRNEAGDEVVIQRGRVAFMPLNRRFAPRLLDAEPLFFRRMAAIDGRAAARREAIHRRVEERRRLRQQERREKIEQRREDKRQDMDKAERLKRLQEKREQRLHDKAADR
jgi:FecR protein